MSMPDFKVFNCSQSMDDILYIEVQSEDSIYLETTPDVVLNREQALELMKFLQEWFE